jgi:hypothetical protein
MSQGVPLAVGLSCHLPVWPPSVDGRHPSIQSRVMVPAVSGLARVKAGSGYLQFLV